MEKPKKCLRSGLTGLKTLRSPAAEITTSPPRQPYRIIRPIIQLRRPRRLMRRPLLRLLKGAGIAEIDGDPRRSEGVIADPGLDPGRHHHHWTIPKAGA